MNQNIWDETARICQKLLEDRASFDAKERTYKLEIAERIRLALEAARSGAEIGRPLRRAFGAPNNLTNWRSHSDFLEWADGHPEEVRQALLAISDANLDVAARVERFLEFVPRDVLGTPGRKLGIASFFLMGQNPAEFPFYKPTPYSTTERVIGDPGPGKGASLGQVYEHHLNFTRRFAAELRERGVSVQDLLDVQGLIWMLATRKHEDCLAWRGEKPSGKLVVNPVTPTTTEIAELADDLLIGEDFLRNVLSLLEDRKQVVFYGPPGTGKTFLVREIVRFLGCPPSATETVQFHPSYSYEDFVQGYRPEVGPDSGMTYRLKDGPLVRLAKHALTSDEKHVLVIDEINRGNLPRILGELLYLLEYRDEEVKLMYADERFTLPGNLLFLSTMNTVDRSIGLIDAALRRRFHFIPMFPDCPPVQGLLARWLKRKHPRMLHVADLHDRLNQELRRRFGRHVQLGPSYFMKDKLDEESLSRLWEHDIHPFLEEQFFEDEKGLQRLTIENLLGSRDENPPA